MNAKTLTAAVLLGLAVPAAVLAEEAPATRPDAAARDAEPRRSFWGSEPGRPYDDTSNYTLPVLPIELSGQAWLDIGYLQQKNTQVGSYDKNVNYAQGRFVLGAAYRRDFGGLFAEARAQFVAFDNERTKSQYESHTQDAFVRVGGKAWDVQVGRFYAWEPYWRGVGIDRYTAEEAGALGGPSIYRLDAAIGHKDEAGQLAAHWYPVEWAAFELGSVYGQESEQNNLGVRPVLALRKYGFLLTGGYEYLQQRPQDDSQKAEQTTKGFAGRLQYTAFGATVAVEASKASYDVTKSDGLVDTDLTLDKTSIGAFVQADLLRDYTLAGGYHLTTAKNEQKETNKHHQAFLAAIYRLPVPGLSVWGVLGFARAQLQDIDSNAAWENDMTSFRVRLQYEFR
ncbi:MAG: hypothetical protein U0229_06910 [Anaeromyxobacter sp.]